MSKEAYEDWIGYSVSDSMMRKLSQKLVAPYYKLKFWDVIGGDKLPAGLDLCIFDFAVSSSPCRAIRHLQLIIGAKDDGIMGPKSFSLLTQFLNERKAIDAIMRYQDKRRDYYSLLQDYKKHGRKWIQRTDEIESVSIKLARGC